jgi:hypothetical protein
VLHARISLFEKNKGKPPNSYHLPMPVPGHLSVRGGGDEIPPVCRLGLPSRNGSTDATTRTASRQRNAATRGCLAERPLAMQCKGGWPAFQPDCPAIDASFRGIVNRLHHTSGCVSQHLLVLGLPRLFLVV